jgi:aerobic-type carbon monoxide dehydrogenase small subunit (CoxS/CutS family)
MPVSDTAQGNWIDRNGGFAGHGEPPTTITLIVDGTTYAITCDPTMAALKAIRELADHPRPRRGCQEGICGKCESAVDGIETRLCITPIGTLEGANVVTPTPRRSIWG